MSKIIIIRNFNVINACREVRFQVLMVANMKVTVFCMQISSVYTHCRWIECII
jgi:hypothetical protein